MSEKTWVIASDISETKLFEGFYNDYREGKGKINCAPVYKKHAEFNNKYFAEALARCFNNFDVRDFRVVEAPSDSYKKYMKELDEKKGWQDVW